MSTAEPAKRHFCRHGGMLESDPPGAAVSRPPSVPPALVEPLARRLRGIAALAGLLWAGYLAIGAGSAPPGARGVAIAAVAASVALIVFAFRVKAPSRRLAVAGGVYLLTIAAAIALVEFASSGGAPRGGLSWSAVWIALFPLIAPCTPKRALFKTMLVASVNPLVYVALLAAGALSPLPLTDLLVLFVPVYLAGFVALMASRTLAGLGSEVSDARRMGAYELETRIAQGGMGEVWRARHQMLRRPAAVKLIKLGQGSSAPSDIAIRRFEREAQVTASLKSPHTVQLYDFGMTRTGTFYYVMELLEGVDLEELVKAHGPLEPARVVHILRQALDSLAEAHEHGLVHRDIKPANIHVSRRGLEEDFVKVLDFGLVKSQGAASEGDTRISLTAENRITGTPAYLAPEMITGEGAVDGRADLYALGCVAYFLLTGKLVFEGQSAMQLAIAHAVETPIPPSQRTVLAIPRVLDKIVLGCLEKRPENRPSSAVALLRMLDQLDPADLQVQPEVSVARRSAPKRELN